MTGQEALDTLKAGAAGTGLRARRDGWDKSIWLYWDGPTNRFRWNPKMKDTANMTDAGDGAIVMNTDRDAKDWVVESGQEMVTGREVLSILSSVGGRGFHARRNSWDEGVWVYMNGEVLTWHDLRPNATGLHGFSVDLPDTEYEAADWIVAAGPPKAPERGNRIIAPEQVAGGPHTMSGEQKVLFDSLFMSMRPNDECEWRMSKPAQEVLSAACAWFIARQLLLQGFRDAPSLFDAFMSVLEPGGTRKQKAEREAEYQSATLHLEEAVKGYTKAMEEVRGARDKIEGGSDEGKGTDED